MISRSIPCPNPSPLFPNLLMFPLVEELMMMFPLIEESQGEVPSNLWVCPFLYAAESMQYCNLRAVWPERRDCPEQPSGEPMSTFNTSAGAVRESPRPSCVSFLLVSLETWLFVMNLPRFLAHSATSLLTISCVFCLCDTCVCCLLCCLSSSYLSFLFVDFDL